MHIINEYIIYLKDEKNFYYKIMPRNQNIKDEKKDAYKKISKGLVRRKISKALEDSSKKRKSQKLFFKIFVRLFQVFLILGLSLGAGATVALWSFYKKLPDVSSLKNYNPSETSEIYDTSGRILAKIHGEENRIIVPLNSIPLYVQNAVISMEDERFYHHIGVDPKALIRAVTSVIDKSGKLVKGGGSTITQQLARNLFLSPEVSIKRKIAEMLLAIKIEKNFSKSEILELYLNQVYWGHNAYGIEAASRLYFGKTTKELDLSEGALIGGLLSSPEYYSPYRSLEKAKWRRSLSLVNMVRNGFITKKQADEAKDKEIHLYNSTLKRAHNYLAPYFTSYVISLLNEKYGDNLLRKGGLKIYTTMDSNAQEIAENVIKNSIARYRRRNINQGALISIDPNTGFIKSIVGGVDYNQSQFNRATQAKRQPGSSFKPFVYVTAFKEGVVSLYSRETDEKTEYPDLNGVWSPQNYDKHYSGDVSVLQAIQYSINTVAVKVLYKVGVDKVIETAKILGIESYLGPNLSLALGSSEVTMLEMATAYGVFATGGKKVRTITPILKIEDRRGNIIEDYSNQPLEQVYSKNAISMLNTALINVVRAGTGVAANLYDRQVAGKTGTTSEHRDSWFVGYIPQLVTVVWVGNDNNSVMGYSTTGGTICAPMWKNYMQQVTRKIKPKRFIITGGDIPLKQKEEDKKDENKENSSDSVIIKEIDTNKNKNLDKNLKQENKNTTDTIKIEQSEPIIKETILPDENQEPEYIAPTIAPTNVEIEPGVFIKPTSVPNTPVPAQ